MNIFLFTDYGAADMYVGQVKAVLAVHAPGVDVIDLLHEAPEFNAKASAHLLAALAMQIPPGSVTLAVVDPGVGGERDAVVVEVDGRWLVGPDNGLLSVVTARGSNSAVWRITWAPDGMPPSFHGRDLFAPIVAAIVRGEFPAAKAVQAGRLQIEFGASDLAEIIYVDHYGNALTGVRAQSVSRDTRIVAAGVTLQYARVFSAVPAGATFWYENSIGLIEIAANACNAAASLKLAVGQGIAYAA
ncbi:MAG: hypothetical protein JWN94_3607 [Betaproteobacteria bacterium]|nr:hypothetical protein [Betaproteobacteria bacterium]